MQVNGARAIHSAWGPHGPSSTSRPAFLPLVCASGSTPYLTPAPGRRKWRKQTIIPGEDEPKWAVSLNISAPLLPVSWNFSSDLWVGNGLPLWGISVCVCVCMCDRVCVPRTSLILLLWPHDHDSHTHSQTSLARETCPPAGDASSQGSSQHQDPLRCTLAALPCLLSPENGLCSSSGGTGRS